MEKKEPFNKTNYCYINETYISACNTFSTTNNTPIKFQWGFRPIVTSILFTRNSWIFCFCLLSNDTTENCLSNGMDYTRRPKRGFAVRVEKRRTELFTNIQYAYKHKLMMKNVVAVVNEWN